MQFEIGSIIEGKVSGLTNFGAFISLPGGATGMVHISEVSNTYVKDIHEHLKEGQDTDYDLQKEQRPQGVAVLRFRHLHNLFICAFSDSCFHNINPYS